MKKLHIGLSDDQRRGSIDLLNAALCNESLLLIKTKKAHWDVVGPQFLTIHKMLDEQYEKIAGVVDKLAERIRALGGFPIGTAAGFIQGATLKEQPGTVPSATAILLGLLDDHEHVCCHLREAASLADVRYDDRGTSDFLVSVLQRHEETAWMLRSFLEGSSVQPEPREVRPPVPGLA
jgi:starvation-inducible DNA-binding protein